MSTIITLKPRKNDRRPTAVGQLVQFSHMLYPENIYIIVEMTSNKEAKLVQIHPLRKLRIVHKWIHHNDLIIFEGDVIISQSGE